MAVFFLGFVQKFFTRSSEDSIGNSSRILSWISLEIYPDPFRDFFQSCLGIIRAEDYFRGSPKDSSRCSIWDSLLVQSDSPPRILHRIPPNILSNVRPNICWGSWKDSPQDSSTGFSKNSSKEIPSKFIPKCLVEFLRRCFRTSTQDSSRCFPGITCVIRLEIPSRTFLVIDSNLLQGFRKS